MSSSSQNKQFTFDIAANLPKQQHRGQKVVIPMENPHELNTVTSE